MDSVTLGNKEFIFTCIRLLAEKNKISSDELEELMDLRSCRKKFQSAYPILLEVDDEYEFSNLADYLGIAMQRYYNEIVRINDRTFLVTNQWYRAEKNSIGSKNPFLSWMLNKLNQ